MIRKLAIKIGVTIPVDLSLVNEQLEKVTNKKTGILPKRYRAYDDHCCEYCGFDLEFCPCSTGELC